MEKPKYYVLEKTFQGELKKYDILEGIYKILLNSKGKVLKSINIKTKEDLTRFLKSEFMYRYWSKCEWEFIVIDWPYKNTIESSHPVKVDVWDQIELNFDLIVDLVWNYIQNRIQS